MQTLYFVSHGEQNLGPWTTEEIVRRLASGEIQATDFIFEDDRGDWIPLMECQSLIQTLKAKRPTKAPPMAQKVEQPKMTETPNPLQKAKETIELPGDEKTEWFVQKATHRFGPLTYSGVIRALQEKMIYEFDHIWREGMERWLRIAEVEQFTAECIKQMAEQMKDDQKKVFMMRKHLRHSFDCEIMVNDNKTVWMGQAFQGSAGGSGMIIRNATLAPGQIINVHFAGNETLPPFNAVCEIVSKKFIREVKFPRTPVPYGVKFIKMDPAVEELVKRHFNAM